MAIQSIRPASIVLLLALSLSPLAARAEWAVNGNPITTAAAMQNQPRSVSDGAGGMFVAWLDRGGANPTDAYVQHILGNGNLDPAWPAAGLAVGAGLGSQGDDYGTLTPQVVGDGAGGVIVIWHGTHPSVPTGTGIIGQRVNANGTIAAGWPANGAVLNSNARSKSDVSVASDGAGGALVTWREDVSGQSFGIDVFAQRVTAGGTMGWATNGVLVCGAANNQYYPVIAPDGAGGAIVAWDDYRTGTNTDVYAQRISSGGTALWAANGLAVAAVNNEQSGTKIVADGSGGAYVAWQDFRNNSNYDIWAKRIDSNGAAVSGWGATGNIVCGAAAYQFMESVALDGLGGVILAWFDRRTESVGDIYIARFTGAGAAASGWPANGLAVCTTAGAQNTPRLVADGQAGIFVTWTDLRSGSADVYAMRVLIGGAVTPSWTANGVPICSASGSQIASDAVADGRHGVMVAWADWRSGTDIYAGRISWGADATVTDEWASSGVPFHANNVLTSPTSALPDGSGGMFVAVSAGNITTDTNILLFRLTAAGTPSPGWPADGFMVCNAASSQEVPVLASDGAGGVFIAWEDFRAFGSTGVDVYIERVTASGTLASGWLANGKAVVTATNHQNQLGIVSDGAGGVILGWADQRAGYPNQTIYAQRVSGAGTMLWAANGIQVTPNMSSYAPNVVTAAGGGAIIVWPATSGIYAQRLNSSGVVQWTSGGVFLGQGSSPHAIADDGGGVFVAFSRVGNSLDLWAHHLNSSGAPVSGWATQGNPIAALAQDQKYPRLCPAQGGGAYIAWADCRNDAGGLISDIYAQLVTSGGALQAGWASGGNVVCNAVGTQQFAAITADGHGNAVIAWQDGRAVPSCWNFGCNLDIYATRMLFTGSADPNFSANGSQLVSAVGEQMDARIAMLDGASALVIWRDARDFPGTGSSTGSLAYKIGLDVTPPAAVTGLVAASGYHNGIASFISPGDDGDIGTPAAYDARYYIAPINEGNFLSTYSMTLLVPPQPAGSGICADIQGLTPCVTYYYAVKTRDECYNWSPISNVVSSQAPCNSGAWLACDTFRGVREPLSLHLSLDAPRPNPADGSASLVFSIPDEDRGRDMELSVFDLQGRRLRTFQRGPAMAGRHALSWDLRAGGGERVRSGVYYLRLRVEGRGEFKRALVVR